MNTGVAKGVVHVVPHDLRNALTQKAVVREVWNTLTPLARNEWICWTISVQKPETRKAHIVRIVEDLQKGKRRPCCWAGCPHR